MERETRKAWENWSNKIIFSGYCFSDLIDTHKQRDYNLCLRVLGNWKRLPFRLTKRCICSKFIQKNNCSHLRSCPVTFKFLSFRFFHRYSSHNLSKFCKLNLKFAQISLRATRFLPAQAIGGKMRAQWTVGLIKKIILERSHNALKPKFPFQSNQRGKLSSIFDRMTLKKNFRWALDNIKFTSWTIMLFWQFYFCNFIVMIALQDE